MNNGILVVIVTHHRHIRSLAQRDSTSFWSVVVAFSASQYSMYGWTTGVSERGGERLEQASLAAPMCIVVYRWIAIM
jgi:hypothetical protein